MNKLLRVLCILLSIFHLHTATAIASEKVFFYHTDPAGSPIAMTDSIGNTVWTADYRPFGEENATPGIIDNNREFVGKEKDTESGMSYFGARYMRSEIGRFISPDPIGAVDPHSNKTHEKLLTNPQRLNAYAYGLNNPYRYIDSDGRFVQALVPILIALGWIEFGEMAFPQTMESPHRDSFIDTHSTDLLMLPLGMTNVEGKAVAQIGSKLEYFLGKATGSAHNVERSTQMLRQLESIGLHDTAATRQYLTDHLTEVLNNPSTIARIQKNGRVVRESLLMGPNGGVKLETVWEGKKLITGTIFGGK